MQESSALRKLENILDQAIKDGKRERSAGVVLLEAMKLPSEPKNLVDFYEILNKAEEEVKALRNRPKIDRYIQSMDLFHNTFITYHIWEVKWSTLASFIESRDLLNTLDSLAYFVHLDNPRVLLEEQFLTDLNNKLKSILDEIITSDLSQGIKRFLTVRIEDILKAIRRYDIDGTEGLEKAAKSLLTDLALSENKLQDEDKRKPLYRRIQSVAAGLAMFFMPTSAYDIVGAIPDIHEFWSPKIEVLVANIEEIEASICEGSKISEVYEKAFEVFSKGPQKSITGGKEIKALPPSKQDVENKPEDETNS